MTRSAWVTVPAVVVLAATPFAALAFGPDQYACGVMAVGLVWPIGLVSVWWMRRLMARKPQFAPVGWGVVTLVRMTVALGGGCAFFFGRDWRPETGVALWVWIIVAYLSTLAAEVFVLAKPGWVGRASVGGRG